MSKYEKDWPTCLFLVGQMHLYPFVYFHFDATDLLKLY